MKLYTPDKSLLIDVSAVKTHPEGLMLEGKIMGAMPMKAILRPEELRAGFGFLSFSLVLKALKMLVFGRS